MLCWHKYVLVCPILIGVFTACSVKPVQLVEQPPTEECGLIQAETGAADSITIAITGQHEKSPVLDPDEKYVRFTQGQIFESLISIDCLGRVRPGLASSWESNDPGTMWTFRLRDDARFSDGERVHAQRIIGNWQNALDQDSVIDSIVAVDDRTVIVYLGGYSPVFPSMLASPLFAAETSTNRQHSVRTGPYRPLYQDFDSLTGLLEPNPFSGNRGPVIKIVDARAKNERDLFSEEIDLFISSDPDVIDYAETLDDYRSIALPWEKTYVLVSTTRVIEPERITSNESLSEKLAHRLARDVVQSSARSSISPSWWNQLGGCSPDERRIPRRPRAFFYTSGFRQILYDENDGIARSLAERIVALASEKAELNDDTAAFLEHIPGFQEGEVGLTAKASSPGILSQSLDGGDDFAYIIPLQVHPFDACSAWSELIEQIPWLPAGPDNVEIASVPLVDAHPHVIVRRGGFGLIVDGFGYLTITSPESGR